MSDAWDRCRQVLRVYLGEDDWTRRAEQAWQEQFDAAVVALPCWGGTGANVVGIATVLENLLQKVFGAYPIRQPLTVEGGLFLGNTHIPYNNLVIVFVSVACRLAPVHRFPVPFDDCVRAAAERANAAEPALLERWVERVLFAATLKEVLEST